MLCRGVTVWAAVVKAVFKNVGDLFLTPSVLLHKRKSRAEFKMFSKIQFYEATLL